MISHTFLWIWARIWATMHAERENERKQNEKRIKLIMWINTVLNSNQLDVRKTRF